MKKLLLLSLFLSFSAFSQSVTIEEKPLSTDLLYDISQMDLKIPISAKTYTFNDKIIKIDFLYSDSNYILTFSDNVYHLQIIDTDSIINYYYIKIYSDFYKLSDLSLLKDRRHFVTLWKNKKLKSSFSSIQGDKF